MDHDAFIMQLCLKLASTALGQTAPNPLVGCLILKDGKIVGEGYHPKAGQPHAEIFALEMAQDHAQGATLYVNLEPCNHYGRTPPCTEAIIKAGISKVVVGMIDPDPRVSGSGINRLRDAGIEVVVGVEVEACEKLNEFFIHRVKYQQPFGSWKYAMTLDGKIATDNGHSYWITSSESRRYVYEYRSMCDAIITGGNTVRLDNPFLTTHGVSDRRPLRVVMSRSLELPETANLWNISDGPVMIFTQTGSNVNLQSILLDRGVEIIELENLSCELVMNYLYKMGLSSVMWECGPKLASSAIASRSVQKVLAFIAPKIIGGDFGLTPLGGLGLTKMTDAIRLKNLSFQSIGSDYLIEGYLDYQIVD